MMLSRIQISASNIKHPISYSLVETKGRLKIYILLLKCMGGNSCQRILLAFFLLCLMIPVSYGKGETMLFYNDFTPKILKDWEIPPGARYALKDEGEKRQSSLVIEYTKGFDISANLEKDVSGYDGILLEAEFTSQGSLNFSIRDCFGKLWYISNPMDIGRCRILVPFKNFSNPMRKESKLGPLSLETLRIHGESLEQNRKQTFTLYSLIPYGNHGLDGPSISIDPSFELYKKRSWMDTARYVREMGFTSVNVIVVNRISTEMQREMMQAFKSQEIACVLRLFPTTDFEAYEKHPEWRQRSLDGTSRHSWRVYLCPNVEAFTNHACQMIRATLKEIDYDAIELAEPWFEVWGGPYKGNPSRGKYACVCETCCQLFQKRCNVNPRDLFDEKSPFYFLKSENAEIYEKWQEFRVDSILGFSQRLYDAARAVRPRIKIIHMHLADCTVESEKSREYQAQDLDAALKQLEPDILVIQDAWQDWTRSDLKPDFVKEYALKYVKRCRNLKKDIILKAHADIGSQKPMQRSYSWMREFSAYAREGGFDSPIYYEFSLNNPPMP